MTVCRCVPGGASNTYCSCTCCYEKSANILGQVTQMSYLLVVGEGLSLLVLFNNSYKDFFGKVFYFSFFFSFFFRNQWRAWKVKSKKGSSRSLNINAYWICSKANFCDVVPLGSHLQGESMHRRKLLTFIKATGSASHGGTSPLYLRLTCLQAEHQSKSSFLPTGKGVFNTCSFPGFFIMI